MPETPLLRPAVPGDVAAIHALVNQAYARWVPLIGRKPRPMTADYAEAVRRHRFDLLMEAGALVALIETDLRSDHLWIENIAVHPDRQGQGIGRRLLAHAEALAHAAGMTELRLLTNGAFAANIALYQRIGFVITAREPFGDGETVYMARHLNMGDPPA